MELNAKCSMVSLAIAAMLMFSGVSHATSSGIKPVGNGTSEPSGGTEKLLDINESLNDLGEGVGNFFKSVGGALETAGSAAGKGIVAIGKGIGAAFVWLGKTLPAAGAAIWSGIVFVFGAIGAGLVWLAGALGAAFAAIGTVLSNLASLIWGLKPGGMTDVEYGAIIAGSVCGAGGASYGIWYWIKKVAPGGAALFTRIPRDDILHNSTRRQIFNAIQKNPGINMSQISQQLDIGWGTTVHHVKKLEEATKIHAESMNNERCFFENGGTFSKDAMVKTAALKDGTAKKIFDFIEKNPETSQKKISESLGVRPSLVSWHVTKLEQEGMVNRMRSGKSFSLTINEKFGALKVRENPAV